MPRKPRGGMARARPGGPDGPAGEEGQQPPPLRLGPERTESAPDGDWVVRHVPGAAATKTYRCPGCDQEITPGTAHVVTWPADTTGPAGRRHWHSPCWRLRLRRHVPPRRIPPRGGR